MKRKYLSGAKKRKTADEKKQKEVDLLKKTTKISEYLLPASTRKNICDSSPIESETAESPKENQMHESIVCSVKGNTPTENENASVSDENESNIDGDSGVSSMSQSMLGFSNDVALWEMNDDLSLLQSFWAKTGLLVMVSIMNNNNAFSCFRSDKMPKFGIKF
jgi:hypothetical protein